MWPAIFSHVFPDSEIGNFNSVPGTLNADTAALSVTPLAGSDKNSVRIQPGQGIGFQMDSDYEDVIGVSFSISLRHPVQGPQVFAPLLQLGNNFRLTLESLSGPIPPGEEPFSVGRLLLSIGGNETLIGTLKLPHRRFVRLRIVWLNDGQVQVFLGKDLAAYRNSALAGGKFMVDKLRIGYPGAVPGLASRFEIVGVLVRVLRENDMLAVISDQIGPADINHSERLDTCIKIAGKQAAELSDLIRTHMRKIRQATTSDWDADSGPAITPFSSDANQLHKLALNLPHAFAALIDADDPNAAEEFQNAFEVFLKAMKKVDPAGFATLLSELETKSELRGSCAAILGAEFDKNRERLGHIASALERAMQTAITLQNE